MKQLLLIGIGPGDPRQITLEALEALQRASVFFMLDKGHGADELLQLRKRLLERYLPNGNYRIVEMADPRRESDNADYVAAVEDWHQARALLYARMLTEELHAEEVGAFLLWGEPTLYDSTLRILDRVRACGVAMNLRVIPGISSVQALAARHRIPLNRIGEPLTVLPARRLPHHAPLDNAVVMLDGDCAFAELDDPGLTIYWGAYLGTEDEILLSGPLQAVKAQILEAREQARLRKGWIMDTYLLRRDA